MSKLTACICLLLALAGSLPASANPVSLLDVFYKVQPEDLAGPPGTLIRAKPMQINSIYRAKA